ncbi:hypothetical protein B0A48_18821 [Cryoendolithus antarcticus]|uniref:DNA 3'-5' helicase n=1 Tax=Cryoendolithus antarcticus TaxID=1507870 RepID=A0A1V8S7B6_9PEZI|nr:hypothetical protein B0A48_18821 [Cryoendolithus antarcticus]
MSNVVAKSYIVFLHQGYSLETHMQTIREQVDTELRIDRIFPEEANLYDLYYRTIGLNDITLEARFAIRVSEANVDDQDAEEIEEDIRIMTRQRNHKTQTVNRAYVNQTGASFGNVWDGLIRTALRASTLWQDFWGVETILKPKKRGHVEGKSRLTKRAQPLLYGSQGKSGNGSLLHQAVAEARDAWTRSGLLDSNRDKIILYVRKRDEAKELADLLECGSYTARSGTTIEKGEKVAKWLALTDKPYLVATSAFAEGFDYPHGRLVINVNERESIVLFAQESGRAGKDHEKAYSLVLLHPLGSLWEMM